jgi:hypothetical protein
VFLLLLLVAVWISGRNGPMRTPWWRGETAAGFAVFVGTIAFLPGFIGPVILSPEANQGPLLGIFFTGPIGFVVGLGWGLVRSARRRRPGAMRPN